MEQKLVQRCETKVDADACKASYGNSQQGEKIGSGQENLKHKG